MKESERPFGLDMPFDEAFRRFIGTDPREIEEDKRIKKKRRPKPPQGADDKVPKDSR